MTDETPAEGWTVFRLPRSHWHCQLANFEWGSVTPKSLHQRLLDFMAEVREGQAPHLLLTGLPGIGKSHLGVSVYRSLSVSVGTQLAWWGNIPAFCEAVKRAYRDGEVDPWVDFEAARRLVVLDDLFGKELTAHERDQIIVRILDTAYQNNAAVLITMNQSHEELEHRLLSHEISRLLSRSTIVPMTSSKDYRR